ncbi:MAG: NAD(P)H-hydrate dehydratase [Mycobacteriales bacterium]
MAEPVTVPGDALRSQWPLRPPGPDSDKDERGRVVVVGGAPGTPGAALLAGLAALRVGAGKLTIATTEATAPALAVAVPEAGVIGLATTRNGGIKPTAAAEIAETAHGADALLIGPGMADPDATRDLIVEILGSRAHFRVVVLDALATTCGVLAESLGDRTARTVITPNRSEADRLADHPDDSDGALAVRLAGTFGVTTVLGSNIAVPDGRHWLIRKGNPGLGTSGSGDVLAGAVTGIAARSGDPLAAAMWGLTLHGTAGDRLAARLGPVGYLARELLDELPGCLRDLSND